MRARCRNLSGLRPWPDLYRNNGPPRRSLARHQKRVPLRLLQPAPLLKIDPHHLWHAQYPRPGKHRLVRAPHPKRGPRRKHPDRLPLRDLRPKPVQHRLLRIRRRLRHARLPLRRIPLNTRKKSNGYPRQL